METPDTKKPAAATAPKAKPATGKAWNKIDKLPALRKNGVMYNSSDEVLLKPKKGKVVPGYINQFATDVDYFHLKAKKGDLVFSSSHGVVLYDVEEWQAIN